MSIQPFILGYGRAGHAIQEALLLLSALEPQMKIHNPLVLGREDLLRPSPDADHSVLFVANPPGLHAQAIGDAAKAGFSGVACEKPLCICPDEISRLQKLPTKTAVFHVYRQMWGPQTLKQMILQGELGDLISIEGRYWQSSTAERSLFPLAERAPSWKNDEKLSGPSDALLDVGTHWIDLAVFLAGEEAKDFSAEFSYANAETKHRDSHAWVRMQFPRDTRAFASISKNVHGAANHFEIHLLGTKKSASWNFLKPDEIFVGEGRDRRVLTRRENSLGARHPAFHGTGWLEGYIEIIRQLFLDVQGLPHLPYPELQENLKLLKFILESCRWP